MTIPFPLPFGRRRLVMSFAILPAIPAPQVHQRPDRAPEVPAAFEATDAELARLNARAAAAEERTRWETQAILHGLQPR